ncbi:CubicO group peptidase, beta-lactamase class C family [Chitinophaga eiseniae]|uniref:CubicO group peptidase, beta-lactamase class C family n=1 Tax=Chitinophaga eiseniae TaxID=634771 RepID=A0A1T4M917_9BACT|nr:serine hydrolase domain-containing protein [Chitinophaga eiseniae]SJZ63337.1 CubicO group peptidase, beta-lactamase class C family [Chitinophaga eiseniae]
MRNYCLGLGLLLAFCACKKKDKDDTSPSASFKTENVEKQIAVLTDRVKIPGVAVALVGPDGIIWSKTAGMANLEKKEAVTAKTVFKIGSFAKPLIGLSIMRLVENGQLNLDADINTYLPFKVQNPRNPGRKITLRALMSHSSGICDSTYALRAETDILIADVDHPMPLSEFVREMLTPSGKLYATSTFHDDRNTTIFSYSNVGSALAAYIVELTVKEDFGAWSYRQFIAPLGTTTLVWHLRDYATQPFAMPYNIDRQPIGNYSMVDYCTGGLHANLADLSTFARMLVNNGVKDGKQIITAGTLEAMGKVQNPRAQDVYGLFWQHRKAGSQDIFGHGGDVPGSHMQLYINYATKRAAVVMINGDYNDDGEVEWLKLRDMLFEL